MVGLGRQEGNEWRCFQLILPLHLSVVNIFQLDLHICSIPTHYALFPREGLYLSLCLFKYVGLYLTQCRKDPISALAHTRPLSKLHMFNTTWKISCFSEVVIFLVLLLLLFLPSVDLYLICGHPYISFSLLLLTSSFLTEQHCERGKLLIWISALL